MDWINQVYGKKYAHLRTKKFEKGYAQEKGLESVGLTPELVLYMDKVIDAYFWDRIHRILSQVGSGISDEAIFMQWKEVLDDMCGDKDVRKKEMYDRALADEKVTVQAKEWLKVLRDLMSSNRHLL